MDFRRVVTQRGVFARVGVGVCVCVHVCAYGRAPHACMHVRGVLVHGRLRACAPGRARADPHPLAHVRARKADVANMCLRACV